MNNISFSDFRKLGTYKADKAPIMLTGKVYDVCRDVYRNSHSKSVLDFGCGVNKQLKTSLNIPDYHYECIDNDIHGEYTYSNVFEIPDQKKYDMIFAIEVIENIEFYTCIEIFKKLCYHLKDKGMILISTPNVLHPVEFLRDPQHITAWNYQSIIAMLHYGYISNFVVCRSNKKKLNLFEKTIAYFAERIYCVDYCRSIIVIGEKYDPAI